MKNTFIFSILLFIGVVNASSQPNVLEDITAGKYSPRMPLEIQSMADGEHYTQINDKFTQIVKYSYKSADAVETLFDVNTARECPFDDFDGYILSPMENRILLCTDSEPVYRHSSRANYWLYDIKRNLVEPLSEENGKISSAMFSPNGRMLAFVRDNNIYLKKLDYGTEVAITKDGAIGKIINGMPDWLYEEEFMMEKGFDWSPDSEQLAFIRFDESDVQSYTMVSYPDNAAYPVTYSYKYPRAGTKNATVSVHAYTVDSKVTKKIDIPGNFEYIPRMCFTPDATSLAIFTLNREQNNMVLFYANPKTTICKQILKEENDTFVDVINLKYYTFTKNNFVAASEKDGYRHAYLYTFNGVLVKQLTSGNWDMTNVYGFDDVSKSLYYQSAEESPLKRAVYAVNEKGKKEKLSQYSGTNDAAFGAQFNYFINTYTTLNTPPVVSINNKTGKVVREVESNKSLREAVAKFPAKEFLTIPSSFGELNAWILKPSNFSSSQKYPVLMMQYNGPDLQKVLDDFEFGWEYNLASKGYIIVCVDGIGTGARGEAFRKASFLNLGIKESDCQVEAAKYIGSLPYIDKSRIGIWGWSFGGFNALMSMSKDNGIFKTGVAVAPVTDWRLYSTAYTERYMRTPNQNYEGYANTSLVNLAGKIQGNVLIIHGNMDDNVHIQHTFEYVNALTEAQKVYDLQLYPSGGHGLLGNKTRLHLYTKMSDYLFKNL